VGGNACLSTGETIRFIKRRGSWGSRLFASNHLLESYSDEVMSGQSYQLEASIDFDAASELAGQGDVRPVTIPHGSWLSSLASGAVVLPPGSHSTAHRSAFGP
jgi:hypothetical protein